MTQFSAQEPSLGYHYQVRYALYLLLKAKDKDNPFVKLENLDDVEVGDLNSLELHQTKFHNAKSANLTDAGVDIWKTIRVWSEMAIKNNIDLDNVLLVLVTTSKTSPNSILYELTENKTGTKNTQDIVDKLNEISKKSTNKEIKDAIDAYNKLTNDQKQKLIKSIHIIDNAPDFDELDKKIINEIKIALLPEQLSTSFKDLLGWWYENCIEHLKNKKDKISFNETWGYVRYIADKLKSDNLPIDIGIKSAKILENDYSEMCFVRQLQEISLQKNAINQSKRDYYRASEQRSKWVRENLLNPQEEIDYDFRLKDDWQGKFVFLQDDIENMADDIVKEKCKQFYKNYYGETYPNIFIRQRVTEPFLVKGSCQMLADKQDIVWHPNYLKP